jgi:hypothetical protein
MGSEKNDNLPLWTSLFERSIELKFAEPSLIDSIDQLLAWFASIEGDEIDAFGEKLIGIYGLEELRLRFEDCMDRLLVSNMARGMFDNCGTKDEAKWRYRKLIRVFHPDRGANSEAWLNFRAEKINGAYSAFQDSFLKSENKPREFRERRSKTRKSKKSSPRANRQSEHSELSRRPSSNLAKADWRNRFGDPDLLEKRAIWSLVSISVIIFTLILLSALLEK